jgi:TonB family protein
MPPAGPSVSRSQRRDRTGPRTLAAVAASIAVNAVVFAWGLSADTLRALRDREQVRQVSVASLTEQDWETNRAVHPSREKRPARAPERQAVPTSPPPAARPTPPPAAEAQPKPKPELTTPSAPAAVAQKRTPALAPRLPAPTVEESPAPPDSAKPPERPTPLVPRDEAASPTARSRPPVQPFEERPAVELGPSSGPEEEPDPSKPILFADRNSRASRNTIAPSADEPNSVVEARPGAEGKPGDAASGEDGKAAKRVKGTKPGGRGDSGDGDEPGAGRDAIALLVPEGDVSRAGGGEGDGSQGVPDGTARVRGSHEADLTISPDAIARISRGARFAINVDEGETTAVNARKYVAARYSTRETARFDPYWKRAAPTLAPKIAPFLDRQRTTEVAFQLNRRGRVSGIRISKSSGIEAMDELVLEAMQRAIWSLVPFPPLPEEYLSSGLTVRLQATFEPAGASRLDRARAGRSVPE